MKIINDLSLWIVKLLLKLRVKNEFAFFAVQAVLLFLAGYFATHDVIPTSEFLLTPLSYLGVTTLNGFVAELLVVVTALMNPALSDKVEKFKKEGKM